MNRLEAIRALLERRQPLLSQGHYPGCETEHMTHSCSDCAALAAGARLIVSAIEAHDWRSAERHAVFVARAILDHAELFPQTLGKPPS